MPDTSTTDRLAHIAHDLWCDQMRRQGWKYGPAFDQRAKVHDALVPFEKLHPTDRRSTRAGVASLEIPEQFAQMVDYPRGPDREFTPEEMKRGLVVESSDGKESGTVESWEVDPAGFLESITVRWPDGELVEHFPPERELRRPSLRLSGPT